MKFDITLGKSHKSFVLDLPETITCDDIMLMIADKYGDEWRECHFKELKHGKWREGRFGNGITVSISKYYICDQCNHTSQKKSRYCPNCGARMDGKKKLE